MLKFINFPTHMHLKWIFGIVFLGLAEVSTGQSRRGQGIPPSFVGRVIDADSKAPIPYASVGVTKLPDSTMVTGGLTGENGGFRVESLPAGEYGIQISFMGYAPWYGQYAVQAGPPLRLGDIALVPTILNLDEAVVMEQQSMLEMKIDRRIFNVGSDLTSTGTNASELLTNVPSVSVDIDGNVFLRGSSNVQILIDGRPSGLTGAAGNAFLQQLPASSIEKVEVITNPSAKFDPDGMAGILNIVLKKEKKSGFNGNAQVSLGNGANVDGNLSLNHRTDAMNVYTSWGWRQRNRWSERFSDRTQSILDDQSHLLQDRSGFDAGGGWTGRIGADFFPSESSTWSFSLNSNFNESRDRDTLANSESWDSGSTIQTLRQTEETQDNWGWDADVSYQKEFNSDRNHNLRIALRQSDSRGHALEDMYEETLHLDSALNTNDVNETDDSRLRTVFSVDYEKPLPDDGRLEIGWKSNISRSESAFNYIAVDSLTYEEGLYRPWNPQAANYGFRYDEGVHAAYGTWGKQWGVWGLSFGLRLEQVFTEARIAEENAPRFENDYFSAYPSFNLSRQRNDENTWIGSYSRRVSRPRGRQVNPFLNDADPRNIRTGNPYLLPEYTHSIEFGHQWSRGKSSITTSWFFKHTDDVIRYYSTLDSLGIRTSTFINLNSRQDQGLEVIAMSSLGTNGSFRLTASVYHLSNNVGDAVAASDAAGWTGNLNGFASWTMGAFWKVQINGMYRGAAVTPQGRFNGYKYMDLAVSRTFLDQALTATCRISDLFDTREWSYTSTGPTFIQDSRSKRQSRFIYLSVQWRFGQMDNRRDRSASGRGGDFGGGMDGGMDF